jgi:hypothetical protein
MRTCARVKLVMDTLDDTAEVLVALRAWADRTPGATVEGTGPIVTTSCGDRRLGPAAWVKRGRD